MTELKGKQVPDRIVMRTSGAATPNPFPARFMSTKAGCGPDDPIQSFPSCSRTSEDSG